MEDIVRDKIREYVGKKYDKIYYMKDPNQLIVVEHDNFYTVRYNADESPLILSKDIEIQNTLLSSHTVKVCSSELTKTPSKF